MLLRAFCLIVSKSARAIALTDAPESTRASTIRLFSKLRGTYSISCFRFRTIVEVSGRYNSFVYSSRTNASSSSGVALVRSEFVMSPLMVVTACCSVFWISIGEFLEHSRNGCFEHYSVDLGSVLTVVYSVAAVCLLRLLQGSISL